MAQIEYDESGGISLYFFAAFCGLVLLPLTYFYWPRRQKKLTSSIPCKCKQCALKNELFSKANPKLNFLSWIKRFLFLIGWLVFFLLVLQASKVEKDYVDYDPFSILGVDRGASEAEIKKAYRKLTLIHHPDKEGGDETKFMQISKAHAALTDPEARENWEKYGNPDGPKAATFGIALPSWIVDKNNSIYVLGIYVACFMIVLPTVVSIWWYRSNKTAGEKIHIYTSQIYFDYLHRSQTMSLKLLMKVLGASYEFDKSNPEMKYRPSDEQELKKIKRELPASQEEKKLASTPTNLFSYPHAIKARLIICAHMNRVPLPVNTLEPDRQYIVRKTPMLLQEMINLFIKLLYLYFQGRVLNRVKLPALENMMRLHQYIIQAIGEGKSPLLQLPHLHESQLKSINTKRREIKSLEHLAKIPNKERECMLNFLEQQEYQDLMNVLGLLPVITLDVDTQVIDDNNQTKITAHSIVTVRCTLKRDCFKNVYFLQDSKSAGGCNGVATYTNGGLQGKQNEQDSPRQKTTQFKNRREKGQGKKQTRGGKKKNPGTMLAVSNISAKDEESETKAMGDTAEGDEDGANQNANAGVDKGDEDDNATNADGDVTSDEELWRPEEDPAKKRRELLDNKPKTSFEVHCPYFPELRQEGWWIYLVESKTQILKSPVEKVSGLKDTETVELKFTAPDQGNYSYTIHVRSDSYVGVDVSKEIKITVAKAEIIENPKQWEFSDEEENEDEEKLSEDEEKEVESGQEQQEWTSLSEDEGDDSDASSDD